MREEDGLAKQVKELRKKVEDARIAYNFVNSDTGQGILRLMGEEVQKLLEDVAGGEPLPHDDYLGKQNRIAALRGFMNRMQTDAKNKYKWEVLLNERAAEYAAIIAAEN